MAGHHGLDMVADLRSSFDSSDFREGIKRIFEPVTRLTISHSTIIKRAVFNGSARQLSLIVQKHGGNPEELLNPNYLLNHHMLCNLPTNLCPTLEQI